MRKWNAEMREKMRKLQKKLLVCLLLACMVLPLGACGSAVEAAKQALEEKKQALKKLRERCLDSMAWKLRRARHMVDHAISLEQPHYVK